MKFVTGCHFLGSIDDTIEFAVWNRSVIVSELPIEFDLLKISYNRMRNIASALFQDILEVAQIQSAALEFEPKAFTHDT